MTAHEEGAVWPLLSSADDVGGGQALLPARPVIDTCFMQKVVPFHIGPDIAKLSFGATVVTRGGMT
jgi:hypothetical protein